MISSVFSIVKKHARTNKKHIFINFCGFLLSFFALLLTINVILNEENLKNSILESYPNRENFTISKNYKVGDFDDGYSFIQNVRPTIEEIRAIDIFSDNEIDYDLSYLLNSYLIKKENLVQHVSIVFEPLFDEGNTFFYSGFKFDNYKLTFEKDFLFKDGDKDVYETFKFDASSYEFKEIKVFNFLTVPTIYYPYKVIKNAAESTYFSTINMTLYDYIKSRNNNDIETNYSLIMNVLEDEYLEFKNSRFSDLYTLSNNPHEISLNFMNLFSTIIDFCFYFLIVIVVLVSILLLYTVYLNILKNHKEIALLRSYGMSNRWINTIFSFEIGALFIISFSYSLSLAALTFHLINGQISQIFFIGFQFTLDIKNTLLILPVSLIMLFILLQIPLYKVRKLNIRKELNSI